MGERSEKISDQDPDRERLRELTKIVRNVMTAGLNPGSIAFVRQCLFPKNSPNLLRPPKVLAHNLLK